MSMAMASNPHLLKSFETALEVLRQSFKRMGTMTAENCSLATSAYLASDEPRALEAITRDLDIDTAFEELRADCFDVLLKFQPVAKDLRLVMGIEHAVGNLERAGDHAKTIARHGIAKPARKMAPAEAGQIADMAALVARTLELSVTALVDNSTEAAKQVLVTDERIDAYRDAVFDAAMVALGQGRAQAQASVGRLFVATALERIGDHATNIAEEVLFVSRGIPPGATRTGSDFG
ncbi:phosphate transport system regulatory protein PhoU [Pseudooceanicola lipolyticus]|uniref:Phosphate-specific transport system accessory protein PhoU n=2 Tax=Pseudooceanicola lipolyticus TaxID=2029104 RepID=A0A2M8J4R4_9RHOB|nr:phosphate transport system regulatory protein PhoU [Pseudooceanicola lipolyticus]